MDMESHLKCIGNCIFQVWDVVPIGDGIQLCVNQKAVLRAISSRYLRILQGIEIHQHGFDQFWILVLEVHFRFFGFLQLVELFSCSTELTLKSLIP